MYMRPQVVNSDRLAQVNKDAGVIHPGAFGMTLHDTAGTAVVKTALYTGDTLTVKLSTAAKIYVDSISLVKIVDASIKNGCDNGDAATSNAGHKDVRSTATVVDAPGVCANQVSKSGQGVKACQAAGATATYTHDADVKFGFAFADLNGFPASASTTTWRLCMVR